MQQQVHVAASWHKQVPLRRALPLLLLPLLLPLLHLMALLLPQELS